MTGVILLLPYLFPAGLDRQTLSAPGLRRGRCHAGWKAARGVVLLSLA